MAETVRVVFDGDSSGAVKAARQTRSGILSVSGASSRAVPVLKSLGKVAAVGVVAGFVAMAGVVKTGFDELAEGQKVAAQTGAVLKSTGGIANVTADDVAKLSGSLSQMSGIDDELIQKGSNLLLTFKNVRNEVGAGNDVFNQATRSAIDLSVAGFGSVESASKMLGKALNDPVKGMTALGRAGVTFSEDQKKAIAEMVKTGDVLGAQKIILAEVESQVGGSAKAFGETLPGQMAKARNSFEEVAAGVADVLLPYLLQLLQWVNRNMPTIRAVIETTLDGVVAAIQFLGPIISTLVSWFQRARDATEEHWPRIRAIIQSVVDWFRANVLPTIQSVIQTIQRLWARFGDEIMSVVRATFGVLATVIGTFLRNVVAIIQGILALLRGDWSEAWNALKTIVSNTLSGLASLVKQILTGLVPAVLGLAKDIGAAIINGIVSGFTGLLGSLKDKLESGIKGVVSGLSPFSSVEHGGAIYIGEPLARGAIRGWIEGSRALPTEMRDTVRNAVEVARTAVEERRGAFASAFQTLTSEALAAFDKLASDIETKTEKKLRLMDERSAAADRKAAIAEARRDLAGAQSAVGSLAQDEGESPEDFARRAAEAQVAVVEAQKRVDEALAVQQRFVLEQQAARERANLENRMALKRRHFEEDLIALQNYASRHTLTAEQMNKRLLAIFAKYGVPFKEATRELGGALAEGLRESVGEVAKAAEAVRREVMDRLSNIEVRFSYTVTRRDDPDGDSKPSGRARGGFVRAGTPYIVGERGQELFVPSQSGRIIPNSALAAASSGGRGAGGGPTLVLQVHGDFVGERAWVEHLATLIAPTLGRVAMYESRV